MTTGNKEVARRVFEEVWNNKKVAAIDELIAANYIHHDAQSPSFPSGIEGYKQFVAYYLNAFPDVRFTIDNEVAEADMVVIRWTATGSHEGDLAELAPTGRHFSVTGITMARLSDGKVAESWNSWDALGMMQQLGAVPEARGRAA
ncbi:MAG: ester cyclase [Acidobacteria bacterium]|nr:ester cyclase [Acidobacteriota bacterium]